MLVALAFVICAVRCVLVAHVRRNFRSFPVLTVLQQGLGKNSVNVFPLSDKTVLGGQNVKFGIL